ncbi:FUSC family protein [Novosphingobium sp. BL-8A]|uniref:FUSC family protein n=1 Tax=Novosphingobium sp. BL-8A TaxID=3127639 RepID=UPI0037584215
MATIAAAARRTWLASTDLKAALFSIKCLLAAALAYYLALIFQFPKPFWAVMTAYIVANPLSGAVHSKAVFRLCGTAIGGAVAVILLPNLRSSPEALTFALAAWLGLCIYLAVLDRTPRAYMFLLAGFTAILVGIPIIDKPAAVFMTAVARVQEIGLGFVCAGFVHSLVWPGAVSDRLLSRVDAIVHDAECWSIDTLDEADRERLDRDRRKLAFDIGELHQLSVHLPFDTGRRRLRVSVVRALQQQLALLAPLAAAVEERLLALREGGWADPDMERLVRETRDWLEDSENRHSQGRAAALRARAAALEPAICPGMDEPALQRLGLAARLAELVEAHENCRALRRQLGSPSRAPVGDTVPGLLQRASAQPLHADRVLALRSGLNAMATVCLAIAVWRFTSWPSGDGAVMIAAICCSLFAGFDRPATLLNRFLVGWALATLVATFYAFAVLPRVSEFAVLIAVLAPYLLLCGSLLARPQMALPATGLLLGLLNLVGLNEHYVGDFRSFANGALAQLLGAGLAVVMLRLFSTVGAAQAARRLVRSNWRDIARFHGPAAPSLAAWLGLGLDRIGLLAPRLAAGGRDDGKTLLASLDDLRVGGALLRLRHASQGAPGAIPSTFNGVAQAVCGHYRQRLRRNGTADPALAETIDAAVRALLHADPAHAREGLLALLTLRRVLTQHAIAA